MALDRHKKINEAERYLKQAMAQYDQAPDHLKFLALSKTFEICIEYVWKELKFRVEDEGLEAQSPKQAVRQAAKLGLITEPDSWINCINARNDSVHDYFGIPEADYRDITETFLKLLENSSLGIAKK